MKSTSSKQWSRTSYSHDPNVAMMRADEPQALFDGTPDQLRACTVERVRQFVEGEARERLQEMARQN